MPIEELGRVEYMLHPMQPDPSFAQAVSLWCWYFVTTEDFDRTVCTMRTGETAIPVTPWERALTNRFAILQMKILRRTAERQRLSSTELERARDVARALTYEQAKEWLSHHGGTPAFFGDF